jgi:hypothetical protein
MRRHTTPLPSEGKGIEESDGLPELINKTSVVEWGKKETQRQWLGLYDSGQYARQTTREQLGEQKQRRRSAVGTAFDNHCDRATANQAHTHDSASSASTTYLCTLLDPASRLSQSSASKHLLYSKISVAHPVASIRKPASNAASLPVLPLHYPVSHWSGVRLLTVR